MTKPTNIMEAIESAFRARTLLPTEPTMKPCPKCGERFIPKNHDVCLICLSFEVHGYNVFNELCDLRSRRDAEAADTAAAEARLLTLREVRS